MDVAPNFEAISSRFVATHTVVASCSASVPPIVPPHSFYSFELSEVRFPGTTCPRITVRGHRRSPKIFPLCTLFLPATNFCRRGVYILHPLRIRDPVRSFSPKYICIVFPAAQLPSSWSPLHPRELGLDTRSPPDLLSVVHSDHFESVPPPPFMCMYVDPQLELRDIVRRNVQAEAEVGCLREHLKVVRCAPRWRLWC